MALDKEIKVLLTAQDNASAALRSVGSSLGALEDAGRQLMSALGPLAGALAVNEVIETATAWDRYKNALAAITGSSAGAQQELDYIWATAEKLGVSVDSLAESWVGFLAASKGTALEGEQTRIIFEAVSNAAAKLGLTSDMTAGALNAVQQMMSKGKITAEELRGQLGERLYGAFNLFAQGAGVSTAQLDEMLQKGQAGIDLLPKFADKLNEVYGAATGAETAQQAMARFNNSLTQFKLEIAEAGVMDVFISAMKSLQEVMSDPRTIESIKGIGQSFDGIIQGSGPALILAVEGIIKVLQALGIGVQVAVTALQFIGDVMASVAAAAVAAAEGEFKQAWDILQDPTPANNFNKNMDSLQKSTEGFWGATDKAVAGAKQLGSEAQAAAAKTGELTAATSQSTTALAKSADAKVRDAEASKKATEATEKQRLENAKIAVELERIASNERIQKISLAVNLKTEQLKAEAEIAKKIIEGISDTVQSTGDVISGLFGNLKGASDRERWAIEDQVEKENKRRDEALSLQKELTEKQIEALEIKNDLMRSGDAMIKMTLDGVEPELEMIMWKIVERLQMRVNEEMASFLLGVPA